MFLLFQELWVSQMSGVSQLWGSFSWSRMQQQQYCAHWSPPQVGWRNDYRLPVDGHCFSSDLNLRGGRWVPSVWLNNPVTWMENWSLTSINQSWRPRSTGREAARRAWSRTQWRVDLMRSPSGRRHRRRPWKMNPTGLELHSHLQDSWQRRV